MLTSSCHMAFSLFNLKSQLANTPSSGKIYSHEVMCQFMCECVCVVVGQVKWLKKGKEELCTDKHFKS